MPGKLPERVWRVCAYPFLGVFVAEAWFAPTFTGDPRFGGVHLISAFVGSLVGVILDWIVTQARHPALVSQPEPRMSPHG